MSITNMDLNNYRSLSNEEISQLISQDCHCDDWTNIEVVPNFIPNNIKDVKFSGNIRLGRFNDEISLFGGIKYKTGIYHATLHNCYIGDNVFISKTGNHIANYKIEDRVVIYNINLLAVDGLSSFGNGTRVHAINEGGGRDIPIYDHLSAHLAYIRALYLHREKVIANIEQMVEAYVDSVRDVMGVVGRGTRIINCNSIKNVKFGPESHIEGATKLNNGSINSSTEDPITIGDGVIMENFIICSGSEVNDSTIVSNCFIGQGCILDKHYSAVDSVFFANCQGFHGEACAIFAGPYTVTHHKSTLLIAGLYSFLNAGSGSNQSNHLYKLGPIHQGIVERGSKTTSDSYILWPSKIGPFSLIMGRHYKNSDTSDFPFSYIIENNNESILVPGANLKSVGTIRDTQKWPRRDKRKDSNLLDYINFNLLSPFTVQKMLNGRKILLDIQKASGPRAEQYSYQGLKINRSSLKNGISLYEMAIWKFMGNSLIKRLEGKELNSNEDIQNALLFDTPIGTNRWVDLAGLICPSQALNQLLDQIANGTIVSLEEADDILFSLHNNYYNYEWTWAYHALEDYYGKPISKFTAEDVITITENWKKSVLEIDRLLYEDARKEFSLSTTIGFGIDGDEQTKKLDYERVRGDFDTNAVVLAIQEHMERKEKLGDQLINHIKHALKNQLTQ